MDIDYGMQSIFPWRNAKWAQASAARVCYESPGKKRRTIVESTDKWRELKSGERDAGLSSNLDKILIKIDDCYLCGSLIGPGFVEEYMFLYPAYQEYVQNKDKKPGYISLDVLHICGCCASNYRRRYLPDWLCMLQPQYWETTILICEEGEKVQQSDPTDIKQLIAIRNAIRNHIRDCHCWLFLLLLLISFSIPISWLINDMSTIKKKQPASWTPSTLPVARDRQEPDLDLFFQDLCQVDHHEEPINFFF